MVLLLVSVLFTLLVLALGGLCVCSVVGVRRLGFCQYFVLVGIL